MSEPYETLQSQEVIWSGRHVFTRSDFCNRSSRGQMSRECDERISKIDICAEKSSYN